MSIENKNLNVEMLLEANGLNKIVYKSPVLEEIQLPKEEVKKLNKADYFLDANSTTQWNKEDNLSNIYKDGDKYFVIKGSEPNTFDKIEKIKEDRSKTTWYEDVGNVIAQTYKIGNGFTYGLTDATIPQIAAGFAVGAAALAMAPAIGAGALATGALVTAATATGFFTAEKAIDAVNYGINLAFDSKEEKNLKEFDEKITQQIKNNKENIDLNSLFDDPYIKNITLFANQENKDGDLFLTQKLRAGIMKLEREKENLSQDIQSILNMYNKVKTLNGSEEELQKIESELKEVLSLFNETKNRAIQNIDEELKLLKTKGNELSDNILDYKTYTKLTELNYFDNIITINNDSKLDVINKIYGENDINKIQGNARLLELGISSGTILSDLRVTNHFVHTKIKNLAETIGNEAANFNNLSQVEQKELLNKYKELGTQLNSYVKSSVEFIDPSKASLVAHIGKKDFIDVKQIDDISKKLGLDNIEIVQNEKKYEQEVTKKEVSSLADIGKF